MLSVNPAAALLLAHQLQVAADAYPVCPHGDPCCPCPDGLGCHYETYGDSPAEACPHCTDGDHRCAPARSSPSSCSR